jgi:glutamate/tyrosine decarboxylase-like PLP-dependent enzyme
MAIKTHGLRRIGRVIEQNVEQAQRLRRRVEDEPELELLGPAPLNVVCFRFRPLSARLAEEDLALLNREILVQLQERGIAVPSSTRRDGRFALRVAITNHRTRREDIDLFADAVLALGRELLGEGTPPAGLVRAEPQLPGNAEVSPTLAKTPSGLE